MMSRDWIRIIAAAYRPAPDERGWVRGVLEAARPALDCGLGVAGYAYESDPARRSLVDLRPVVELGVHADTRGALRAVLAGASPALVRRALRAGPCTTLSALTRDLPRDRELIAAHAAPLGIRDLVGLSTADPTGVGVIVTAPRPRVEALGAGAISTWSRVAAHLAAGFRLQRLSSPAGVDDHPAGVEAILDDRGRLLEAAAAAAAPAYRAALREAAVALTRAMSLRRTDLVEAVAAWRALVAGRWSFVDRFDRDGRHFLIARRNDPPAPALAHLSLRERQVVAYARLGHSNKLIAYELGLAPTTIASHLARAAAKLGVASRIALIRACAQLAVWGASTETSPGTPSRT